MEEHPFLPLSQAEREEMLKEIGVESIEDLLVDIPEEARFKGKLNLPPPLSEMEVEELLEDISSLNDTGYINFLGAGVYDHYIPRVIDHIVSRSEFYTAYTPYQAEVSQGTLQAMYEYQSLISELTAMEVSNASMYDGASALAEAVLMALRIKKGRGKILIPENLNPLYRKVIESYLHGQKISLLEVRFDRDSGQLDVEDLERKIENASAIVLQHPNFFGILEDPFRIGSIAKEKDVPFIVFFDPISLGILAPPGEYGADIAVAEGQSLGINLSFGGPYIGIFTTRREYIRQLPGRISGMTVDRDGKRGFVMALQTREQHIKRERATSNICTNQMLCALRVAVYLTIMGKAGIREVAEQSFYKSHYLSAKLEEMEGVEIAFSGPFFKEFVIKTPIPAEKIVDEMGKRGILAGVPLSQWGYGDLLLVAVTEKRKKSELLKYIDSLKEVLESALSSSRNMG
jgi:glycine dehydrogenase subunit 1